MILKDIISSMWSHPFNHGSRRVALERFIRWQVGNRILKQPVIYPFVDDARLIVAGGMAAVTGNVYSGLMEFEEMGFIMHYLRPTDLFFDIGANVGVYTVLGVKVCGARCLSVEPVPETFNCLEDNLNLNRIGDRVVALNVGIAKERSTLRFTSGAGVTNRVLLKEEKDATSVDVEVVPLDEIPREAFPELIKVDVEGYESEVVDGGGNTFAEPGLNVVLMELRGHGAKFGVDELQIDRKMRRLGFGSYVYDPLERTITPRTRNERPLGDMMYIRNVERARDRVHTCPPRLIHGKKV